MLLRGGKVQELEMRPAQLRRVAGSAVPSCACEHLPDGQSIGKVASEPAVHPAALCCTCPSPADQSPASPFPGRSR